MKISDRVYLIASGSMGCSMTHTNDCNVYAVDCGGEFVMVDAGCGIETERVIAIMQQDGIALESVRMLIVTHGHLDHSGGARDLKDRLGLELAASPETARALETGDEEAISLGAAKRAGVYPAEVSFQACPVDRVLHGGDRLPVGDSTLEILDAPGHSRDMINLLLSGPGRRDLFASDTVFHGGRILLQDVADCDIPAYSRTLRRLAAFDFDGLYSGHLIWSVRQGRRHLEKALEYLDRLLLPPNII